MPVTLTTRAKDKSSYVVRINFYDEDGDAVVPTSITWSLYDEQKTVINSRTAVAVAVPAATVDIMLSGDDLKYSDGKRRIMAINAVYNSDLAAAVPLKDEIRFSIEDLANTT